VHRGEQVSAELPCCRGPAAVAELLQDRVLGDVFLHEKVGGSVKDGRPLRITSKRGRVR
jgi:hypothetical protein